MTQKNMNCIDVSMPGTLLSVFKKKLIELIQTILSEINKRRNGYNKNKLDRTFSNAEKDISKWENNPNALLIEKERYIYVIDGLWATIYYNSIATFVGTIEATCKKWKVSKEEYKQIEPLLEKWGSKVIKIEENHEIGYQLFNDFRNDLKEFTEKYPHWFDDGSSMLELFDERIWNPIFKSNCEKVLLLTKRIEKILDKNKIKIKTMIDSDYSLITPFEFENFISELFKKIGYNTEVTSKTGDYGIDVIAKDKNDVIAIQVKKYSKGNNVSNRDVQRLLGAMHLRTIKANKAILITTSDFTMQAKEQAKEAPIELWNGSYLNNIVEKYMQDYDK